MAAWSRFLAAAAAKVRGCGSAPVAPQTGRAAAASGGCFTPSTGAAAGGLRRRFALLFEKVRGGKASPAPKASAAADGAKAAPKASAAADGAKAAPKGGRRPAASTGSKAAPTATTPKASAAARRSASTDASAPPPPPPHPPCCYQQQGRNRSNDWYRFTGLGGGAIAFVYQMLRLDVDKEVDRKLKEEELKAKEKVLSEMETLLRQKDMEIQTLQTQPKKGNTWWFF